jgi:hypothetical protein
MTRTCFASPAPTAKRVRGYFSPVDRVTHAPTIFDAAEQGDFNLDSPPEPWVSLGWIQEFKRSPLSKSAPILTGIPAAVLEQVRETVAAEVSFKFLAWTKLTMALATGSQHMNLLVKRDDTSSTAGAINVPAVSLLSGSTANFISLSASDAAKFSAGSMVAIDVDYAGQTGFVGSPIAGAYVRKPLEDPDYIRRVTFNVGLVAEVSSAGLTLAEPLSGGVPSTDAKAQPVVGFVDREGGNFYQEWSALFVIEGDQGERIFFHYPRLQCMASAEETMSPLDEKIKDGHARVELVGRYMAMPVTDPLDGERVLCYRSFLPAPKALI